MENIYLYSNTPKKGVKHVKILHVNFLRPDFVFKGFGAIIFTSKNAVKALEKMKLDWKNIPSFCIGSATAQVVKNYGGRVEYICENSYGDKFAHEIKPLLDGKKILFPRAKEVVSNIKEILKPLQVEEIIVYETLCSLCKNFQKPPPKSILIFTSPSAIKCFLKCFCLDKSYKIICIGKKTANSLPDGFECEISSTQSIDECIKMANDFNALLR